MKGTKITKGIVTLSVMIALIVAPLSSVAEHNPQHLQETNKQAETLLGVVVLVGLGALILSASNSAGGDAKQLSAAPHRRNGNRLVMVPSVSIAQDAPGCEYGSSSLCDSRNAVAVVAGASISF